ncbi:MAG: TonB-dependent siderophore receptor [Geminicoccaceae bacterium]
MAQQPLPIVVAQAAPVAFAIPPQPLGSALTAFGQQAALRISADPSITAGLASPGVTGNLSPDQALQQLLGGSGLSARFANGGVIVERAVTLSGDGSIELDPIMVEEEAVQNALTSPPGFVATQSSVATKTDTPVLEVPRSVSVITRDELDNRNVQSDPQALSYTPGLWAQPFGGAQNLNNPFYVIRGFQSAFGGSYVDGLVSSVNYHYEPFGIERYDVLRGPSSSLYGQADPGGLVNRTSKRPTRDFLGEVQLETGNYNRGQAAVDIGGPLNEQKTALVRVTALARNADAPIDYDFGVTAPDNRKFVAPTATFELGADTSLTLLGSFLDDRTGQESVVMFDTGDLTHVNLGKNDFDYQHQQGGYELQHFVTDAIQLTQNFRFGHLDTRRFGYFQGAVDQETGTVERFLDGFEEERHDVAVDTNAQARAETGPFSHTLLFGADYQYLRDRVIFSSGEAASINFRDPDYDQPTGPYIPYLHQRATNNNFGLYFQDQITYDKSWILTLGGRQDWANGSVDDELQGITNDQDDQDFTYRVGLTYLTDFGLAPYASYATSFLPTSGADAEGKPFKPTTGHQYEAGIKYRPSWFDGLFTVAVYDLTKENVITPDPENGPFATTQVGEIRSRGIELEGTASLTEGLNLTVAYAYNDAEVTEDNPDVEGVSREGNRPQLAPENLASAWLDYTFQSGPLKGLLLGTGGRYVGKTYADEANTFENDAYFLVDASVRYDFGNMYAPFSGASFMLSANNLFDKEYYTCFSLFDCNWGAGRTIYATLGFKW